MPGVLLFLLLISMDYEDKNNNKVKKICITPMLKFKVVADTVREGRCKERIMGGTLRTYLLTDEHC